ncbi:MAG: nuclear transport factor 2 family protein [Pseudomonadota bacterium]
MTPKQQDLQTAKQIVRAAMAETERDIVKLSDHVSATYHWRGVMPFFELDGVETVLDKFWHPLTTSFSALHRREAIFFAGFNQHAEEEIWTCSQGHFVGLFDQDFVGIPANQKTSFIPYAEFHRVNLEDKVIEETALFIDLIALQQQVGLDPIPTQTGSRIMHPSPLTRDGVRLETDDPAETEKTRELLDLMIQDLADQNKRGAVACPPDVLRKTWNEDMAWYGPAGIGTAITIPRYQVQHQTPFRTGLGDKVFNGHVCRITEGHYSGWFGWPNLNNRNLGGFLGLEASDTLAEMRVVDIYRRDGDKLAENWVYIDLLYYVSQHGIDLLKNPDALHKR